MKRMVFTICVLVLVFLPAGRDLRITPADAARPAQAARACQNIQLLIRPQSSQGAAGTIALIYRIHNLTGRPCTLYGYPGIQLLNRSFLSLPTTVHRGGSMMGSIPVTLVRLGSYGNAYFALFYSDVPVGNRPCQTAATYLMIWAPNDVLPVVTNAATRGGSISSCTGDLFVSPVAGRPRY